jgi:carbon storage regulator
MLVLSRKLGERIVIGRGDEAVTLIVVELAHGRVRLGIEAPRSVPVMRAELLPRKDGKEDKR